MQNSRKQPEDGLQKHLLPAAAHTLVLAQGAGLMGAFFIYTSLRGRHPKAAFQALQATVYQFTSFVLISATWLASGVLYMTALTPLLKAGNIVSEGTPLIVWLGMGTLLCPLGIMGLLTGYGLWGALQVWLGVDFRYFLIGRLLENRFFK